MPGEVPLSETAQPRRSLSYRELVLAAFLVVSGGVVVALSMEITPGVQTDPLGPRFFPIALGAGIALCGLLLAAVEILFRGEPSMAGPLSDASPEGEEDAGPFSPARFVGAIAATALYVAAFDALGYLLATPPYIAAILLIHGGTRTRALLITPFVVTIALYVTFRFGLLIPVPDGPLEGILPW
jgi:putative tricarboxylic transport membrane protein